MDEKMATNTGVEIRRADDAETAKLLQLWLQKAAGLRARGTPMWDVSQFSLEGLKAKYDDPVYFVAYDGGQIFGGFILLDHDRRYWPEKTDPAFYLHKFMVCEGFTGRGYSSLLLDWIKAYAGQNGKAFVRLDYDASRAALVTMYQTHGFVAVDEVEDQEGHRLTRAEVRCAGVQEGATRRRYFDEQAKVWDQQAHRVARAAEVAGKIRSRVALGPGVRALEFGCGTGLLGLELVAEVGDLTFADTSSGMLDQVALKIADRSLTNASTLNLSHHPLPQGFDLVFSLMVLHHIDDARAQVEALAGALAPEGTLCLGDLDREDGSFHAPEVVPHNGFLRPTIEGWLQESGLTVTDTCTGFVNRKLIAGQEREFPMFLITARRAPVAAV